MPVIQLDTGVLGYGIAFTLGFCSFGLVMFAWLGVFEPWVRKRRTRLYLKHLDRQYDRQKMIQKLEATIATTDDVAKIRSAQYHLRNLQAYQRMSHEVYPLLHPEPQRRRE